MKKELFLEPEIEVLNFLCNELLGHDSYNVGDEDDGENLPIG